MVTSNVSLDVSFVIPVYNEVENITDLVAQVSAAGQATGKRFEMVIVDDGSTDGTTQALAALHEQYDTLSVVCFRRNFGQTAAMAAGIQAAQGRYIVTLDGDLQNDPADVPALLAQMDAEQLDIISGWRKNRQDKALSRKLPSSIANWLIGKTTGIRLHDYGCSLKVYRSDLIKQIPLYGEMHRFIPALASIEGARIAEVPVNHRARTRGVSKYNLSRTFKVILDLLTVIFFKRFFTRPLHMFGRVGMLFLLVGVVCVLALLVEKLVLGHHIGSRPLLVFSALFTLTGVQLISTGLIAEIQVRTYFESQNKTPYNIRMHLKARA